MLIYSVNLAKGTNPYDYCQPSAFVPGLNGKKQGFLH
jgi:hypothetical protein